MAISPKPRRFENIPFWLVFMATLVAAYVLTANSKIDTGPALPALLVAFVAAWPIYQLLLLTKSRQKIDPHAPETHKRKQGTPTMGGIIILIGAVVAMTQVPFTETGLDGFVTGSWILLLGFAAIGFVDDFVVPRAWKGKRGLGWKQKIVLEIAIATVAAHQVVPYPSVAFIASVFLILFFSNAYNFSDGLDGLAGVLWLGLAIGVAGVSFGTLNVVGATAMAVAGGMVVFLFLNAPPAKVFMGDVGSLPIGAILGWCIAALLWTESPHQLHTERWVPLAILSTMMIIELVPVPMQVAYFKLTNGKRLFPMTPIHHAFEKMGWPESNIVGVFGMAQLVMSLTAIRLASDWQYPLCGC